MPIFSQVAQLAHCLTAESHFPLSSEADHITPAKEERLPSAGSHPHHKRSGSLEPADR